MAIFKSKKNNKKRATKRDGNFGFTSRPLPSDKEIKRFNKILDREIHEDEIHDSLSEIYQDDHGRMVNVSRLDIRKRSFFLDFLKFLFTLVLLSAAIYAGYLYLNYNEEVSTDIEFILESSLVQARSDDEIFEEELIGSSTDVKLDAENLVLGEEFFYFIRFRNPGKTIYKNVGIEVIYPENFVFIDSIPQPSKSNNFWDINNLLGFEDGEIKIRGKIVAPVNTTEVMSARIRYMPENFSSEFKKSASLTSTVFDLGFFVDFDYLANVLAGDENELILDIKKEDYANLSNFRLTIDPLENLEFISGEIDTGEEELSKEMSEKLNEIKFRQVKPGSWIFEELIRSLDFRFKIKYRFTKKRSASEILKINFENIAASQNIYNFLNEELEIGIMNSDLNLDLLINGTQDEQAFNQGDHLAYSVIYQNNGEAKMENVIIMVVLEGEMFDWNSLKFTQEGKRKENMIIWTHENIPGLASLAPLDEGKINFEIDLFDSSEGKSNYELKSYAQFNIGNKEEFRENMDRQSKVLVNKINSDLVLEEDLVYFNANNIPVGSGPLPPQVGVQTSFRIFWNLSDNVHELENVVVRTTLPEYVEWGGSARASVGTIFYDDVNHSVLWRVGRLPVSVIRTNAEFSINFTPSVDDKDKVIALLTETSAGAQDKETGGEISKNTQAKTTRLEDDEIAGMSSDGRVVGASSVVGDN